MYSFKSCFYSVVVLRCRLRLERRLAGEIVLFASIRVRHYCSTAKHCTRYRAPCFNKLLSNLLSSPAPFLERFLERSWALFLKALKSGIKIPQQLSWYLNLVTLLRLALGLVFMPSIQVSRKPAQIKKES